MNLFFTPDKTFSVSLEWSEEHKTFLPIPPVDGEPIFDLATPTERQAHENYHALLSLPFAGGFERTEALMWGTTDDKGVAVTPGLVKAAHGIPAGMRPTPALTLALARIVREECGMAAPLVGDARKDAEGNSGSPSGSGSDSTPSPAGSAETPTADRT